MKIKLVFLLGAFLVLLTQVVLAQVSAGLSGKISDPNGALVAGAKVSLRCENQPILTIVSDVNGEFNFENVAGKCSLNILHSGFAPFTDTLQIPQPNSLNVVLQINQALVTVTAETGNTESKENIPQAVTLIGSEQITQKATAVLAQVADEEVGVSFQKTSPTIGAIAVRGLTGKNVSVYVDGVRYTNSAQRGGINTFFNLNDPTNLQSVEILRGANSAQYGSDSLGGTVNLLTRTPNFSSDKNEFHGEFISGFASADRSFGGSTLLSYGSTKLGGYFNLAGRRINTLRSADGLDTHAAVTRFLGLPSDILGTRLPGTDFTQYGGAFRLNYSPRKNQQIIFKYQRSQQDGGKRYDQLLGGDGNLIADLRNLMLDFGYLRYVKQKFGFFDGASFTVSYNSQREERVNQGGQGNPFGTITNQYERTTANGFSFFLDKQFPFRNTFLIGGDYYFEKINSPAFSTNPVNGSVVLSRPRVPDEARYISSGLFIQNAWEAIPERLRFSGAIRYNIGSYRVRAIDSPIVNGLRLWDDDSLRAADFSGRIGAVARLAKGFNVAFNYTRGFRYPSMTDLGTLGLTGDGFEVDYTSAINLGGTIGTDASAHAVSTGLPVSKQRSEYTNTYDFSLRYSNKRFDTDFTTFWIDLRDTITKQALILPLGSVGRFLGDQQIISQRPNGTVFVAASTNPVLVRANFTSAKIYGFEYELETKITDKLEFRGNYTFIRSADRDTGLPPNIEGGTPPPQGIVSLRYEPNTKMWFEGFMTFAQKQDRLSTLDLADRRTGAIRTRTQIQNFFRRGACVYGLTNNPDGRCGTGDETILLATGETLTQVQNRVLGIGVDSAPLFTYLPSFALFNLRGGFNVTEKSQIFWSFENITDAYHRKPSWGIDGAGRSFKIQYRFSF
jgi:outer membrane receptor protein involved in Fe transport